MPKYLPNSDLSKGATQYRVNENSGDYVIVGNSDPVIDKDGNYTITFTNQLTTSFTVTKLWEDAPNDVQDWNVEVGLYRYTDEKGTLEEDAVLDEDGNAITCVLSGEQAPSGWSHRFTNLAKYDADGKEYHYYVQELSVNGVKVDADSGTVNDLNFVISYAQTTTGMTITNRAVEEISVQKYWWGETGQEVKVALYTRSYDAQGNEVLQEVNDPSSPEVTPYVLTLNAAGNWQGTFVHLAPYDANGNKIEYVIRELDAADQPIEANGKWNDEYTVSYEEHAIYNVGYGDLKITKTLAGDAAETDKTFHFEILLTAPEDHPDLQQTTFTYVRYDQAGEEIESGTITRDGQLELKGNESLIIQDIPADYRYEVKEVEANQNGYTTISDGASGTIEVEECAEATFVNAREPYDLLIVKKVTGIGDKEKEFHFTLSLKDAQGNDLTGTIAYSREDGSTGELTLDEYGTCMFVLSDGQSIMIEDLPNGTTYVIKEEEANKDGYITTVQEEIRDTIEGSIDTNQTILFVNDLPKETSPSDPPSGNGQSTQDTGTINSVIFYSVLGIMAGDAVIFATILRKKRKNK